MTSGAAGVASPATASMKLDQEGTYLFRFTVSDEGGRTATADLALEAIGLDHFALRLEQDTVAFTESSKIFVQAKDARDRDVELDPGTQLKFSLEGDWAYGTFIKPDGDTLKSTPVQLENIRYEDAKAGKVVFAAVAVNPVDPVQARITVELQSDGTKRGEKLMTVVHKQGEILLGETKYYQVKESFNQAHLIVEELETPELKGGTAVDVWGNSAVSVRSGDKLGVYWEKKYPVWSGTTFAGMAELPMGLIRLVGRYWEEGKIYKVKLRAEYNGKTGELVVEVKKPGRLGDAFGKSKDVFDNEINIDDICIIYGGRYGIPPHLIKGQMEQEAATKDFGPYVGFAPSYRFEPYTTQFGVTQEEWGRSPFFVTVNSMGSGACIPSVSCPPNHQHVQTYSYITESKSLWDIVYDYSQLVVMEPPHPHISPIAHRIYGRRNANGTMNFGPYERMQGIYDGLLNYYLQEFRLPLFEAADSARNFLIRFLRDDFYGGFKNLRAQTRIASSYGLLQIMYTTATRIGYNRRDPQKRPEDLNAVGTTMFLSLEHQLDLLIDFIGEDAEAENNWTKGFEKSLEEGILARWNKRKTYPSEVMTKSQSYLPQH